MEAALPQKKIHFLQKQEAEELLVHKHGELSIDVVFLQRHQ